MRLIGAASVVFVLALTFVSLFGPDVRAQQRAEGSERVGERDRRDDGARKQRDGQSIFRFDTFGDEQLWTETLQMQQAIASVSPAAALGVGLKVDVEALPRSVIRALRAGQVDLKLMILL